MGVETVPCACADVTPIFFAWEKLVGTHEKPAWIRLPSRLPVGMSLSPPRLVPEMHLLNIQSIFIGVYIMHACEERLEAKGSGHAFREVCCPRRGYQGTRKSGRWMSLLNTLLCVCAALLLWLLAIAFPFYSLINSIIGALTASMVSAPSPCFTQAVLDLPLPTLSFKQHGRGSVHVFIRTKMHQE